MRQIICATSIFQRIVAVAVVTEIVELERTFMILIAQLCSTSSGQRKGRFKEGQAGLKSLVPFLLNKHSPPKMPSTYKTSTGINLLLWNASKSGSE